MKPSHLLVGLVLNIVAGVVCYYLPLPDSMSLKPHWLTITAFLVGITAVAVLAVGWIRLRYSGLVDVVPSMTEGKGSTSKILASTQTSLCFMGIAARKWVKTGQQLENILRNPFREVKFLLLDPDSTYANDPGMVDASGISVPEKIRQSLHWFRERRDRGCNVQVRLYSFRPLFRVAIVDERFAYVGFYRPDSTGEDSPQLIFDVQVAVTFLYPFREYFKRIWEEAKEPDWTKF